MRISTLVVGLAGALALAGCGGEDGAEEASNGQPLTCEQADVYVRGIEKQGTAGVKVALMEADPAPPTVGEFNTWRVRLSSASGEPVTDATLTLTSTMPQHGHGTTVPPDIRAVGDGVYEVSKVYPSMAGLWRFQFEIASASGTDSVIFWFCV